MAETKKTLIGNIKGPQGEPGEKGVPGNTGATGQRGSGWTQGMAITGTDTEGTVFPESGIEDSLVNDNYLNTYTGNTYRCILGGDASTAEWVYTGNLKGPKGESPQITVDAALGDSENPVQNKAITDALGEKANSSELDKDVAGSYAAGVSEEISGINAGLIETNNHLNGYRIYNSFEELEIDKDTATYMDFVNKMPANSILICSVIAPKILEDVNISSGIGYIFKAIRFASKNGLHFVDFEVVQADTGASDRFVARYANWARIPWSGWRRITS